MFNYQKKLLFMIAGFCAFFLYGNVTAKNKSVAVIPFSNLTGNQNLNWLSPVISESINVKLNNAGMDFFIERTKKIMAESNFSLTVFMDENKLLLSAKNFKADVLICGYINKFIEQKDNESPADNKTVAEQNNDTGEKIIITARFFDLPSGQPAKELKITTSTSIGGLSKAIGAITEEFLIKQNTAITGETLNKIKTTITNNATAIKSFGEAYNAEYGVDKNVDYDSALTHYTEAIVYDPNMFIAYFKRGAVYQKKHNLDKALEDFIKTIKLNPNFAPAYYNRGSVYGNKGNFDLALEDFTRSIQLSPDDAASYFYRGLTYNEKGKIDSSIDDFTKAISLDSSNINAYYNRGTVLMKKGEFDNAIADFKVVIKNNPNDYHAYNEMGISYSYKSDFKNGIESFNKAISINPNLTKAYYNRAISHFFLKDYKKSWADIANIEKLGGKVDQEFVKKLKYESAKKKIYFYGSIALIVLFLLYSYRNKLPFIKKISS